VNGPVISGVVVTLPSGQRRTLCGRRARIVRWLAECPSSDEVQFTTGRLLVNWGSERGRDLMKYELTRFDRAPSGPEAVA